MKTINIILIFTIVAFLFKGCETEFYPKDELAQEEVETNPEQFENVIQGVYGQIKRWYAKEMKHLTEFHSDDVAWVKHSGHDCNKTYGFQPIVNHWLAYSNWEDAYSAIYSCNKVIENIGDDASQNLLNLKGEALFLRAKLHYDMVRVFSRPYTHEDPADNLGVPIRKSTDQEDLPPRSSVKETYEFIVSDFLKAAELMEAEKSSIYGSTEAAWAYLSRMYLYMEENEKAIEYADKVINSGRYELISTENLGEYFTMVPENNPETIFAFKRVPAENLGKGGLSSLYHEEGGGWGEIPLSVPFVELIYENPNDERIEFIEPKYNMDEDGNKIPDPDDPTGYEVETRLGYPKYFNVKYTRQSGIEMLTSPVQIRLAEMYLNKAEAYAKMGEDQNAIDNVNIIRERAGLSGDQLYTTSDLHGYDSVLDVVLVERRLEFFVEGHRSFDVFRNKRGIDRSYTHGEGWAGPQYIPYTSNRIVELIPERVMRLNPQMEQNPLPE